MSPIPPETILQGKLVELIPLEKVHFEELTDRAQEKRIWEFIPITMSSAHDCIQAFTKAIIERDNGSQFPFVIYHKQDRKIIGSTRLMNIEAVHRKLEIGWTWLHPDYWATAVNVECKLLLLTFCFETLQAIRVQLKTDENNIRSRKAIAKIGGTFEGILRNDWIRDDGTFRNSAYFSIIHSEWEITKTRLNDLLHRTLTA